MRSLETRDEALRLVTAGLNDCEIGRRLEIPRTTVRDWRKPRYIARRVGLRPRRYARAIRLYRREDVALLVEHVGTKS